MNKNNKNFNLVWVLLIVTVTSIISALTTGIIIYNNNKITNNITYNDLMKDKNLNQFLEVYANITSEYYENINREELLNKAISAMMNYLGDDYTTYLDDADTEDLVSKLAGEYIGIGVSINNENKTITKVFEDTPASKVGIQEGDIIIGINGIDVSNKEVEEIVKMIKDNNDYFAMKIKRNDQIIDVSLRNEKILSPNIEYKMIENTSIGYIYIESFSSTLDVQMQKALAKLETEGMTSLIIDLRDNTGGYLDAASKVTSMFTTKGKTIYSLNDKDEKTDYLDETDEKREYPIVILTNKNTASASEIMAAALKENYGATLVGDTTYGKGKVQQTMKLDGGSMVKYTSAYWLTPNGNCIDGKGLNPDYFITNEEIKDENGTVVGMNDKQLEKAISILSE